MNIKGLDYNTMREPIRLSQYGREVQQMVDHCVALPTKAQRQSCAEGIIATMKRMVPSSQNPADRMQTLWDHLALMSNFKLDIDYPVKITTEEKLREKPNRVPYPPKGIRVRHYGQSLFQIFDRLKTMSPGAERDALVARTANQMKRCLLMYGHGNGEAEKVADDLARFTDGIIQLDLDKFTFDKIDVRAVQQAGSKKKKKK